jgi:hypothetical protein
LLARLTDESPRTVRFRNGGQLKLSRLFDRVEDPGETLDNGSPGRYMLHASATFAGHRSRTATVGFTILTPPAVCNDPDHDADCDAPGAS